jgi:hypothetical protein
MLIGAVVIHEPEFFVAGASADESDLRGSDATGAAGQLVDNFVGELMSEFANLRIGGIAAIHFADYGLRGGIANVVHPGVNDDFGGSFGEIAESDEIGIERRISPGEIAEFAGLRKRLRGIKTGADKIENATEGEVVTNDGSEESGVSFGLVGARDEIGDGDARFFGTDSRAGTKPSLFLLSFGDCSSEEDQHEKKKGTNSKGQRRLQRYRPRMGSGRLNKQNNKNGKGAGEGI